MKKAALLLFVVFLFVVMAACPKSGPEPSLDTSAVDSTTPPALTDSVAPSNSEEEIEDNLICFPFTVKNPGGVNAKQGFGYVAESENALFVLGDNYKTIYKESKESIEMLYSSTSDIESLSFQDEILYFTMDSALWRLPLSTLQAEMLVDGLRYSGVYAICGSSLYVILNDDGLYYCDLTDTEDRSFITGRVAQIVPVENGLFFSIDETLYFSGDGDIDIISQGYSFNNLQIVNDEIYFHDSFKIIYKIAMGQGIEQVLKVEDVCESGLQQFIIYDSLIYILDENYRLIKVDLADKKHSVILEYVSPMDCPEGYNGILEPMHIFGFQIADGHVYFDGKSSTNGFLFVTRFSIGEQAERMEEVLLDGEWISVKTYVQGNKFNSKKLNIGLPLWQPVSFEQLDTAYGELIRSETYEAIVDTYGMTRYYNGVTVDIFLNDDNSGGTISCVQITSKYISPFAGLRVGLGLDNLLYAIQDDGNEKTEHYYWGTIKVLYGEVAHMQSGGYMFMITISPRR